MFDEETERIKQRLRDKLKSYTYYDHYCCECGKFLCRIAQQTILICYDCWRFKNPPKPKPLLLQLIDEINARKSRS